MPDTDSATISPAPVMKFSHLGLVVRDLPMMEQFYTGILGFALTEAIALFALVVALIILFVF